MLFSNEDKATFTEYG